MRPGEVLASLPPWVNDHLLGLFCIQGEIIVLTPCHKFCHLSPIRRLGPTSDQSDDCSIVRELYDTVVVLGGHTVRGEEGVQQGTQYAALGGPYAYSSCL